LEKVETSEKEKKETQLMNCAKRPMIHINYIRIHYTSLDLPERCCSGRPAELRNPITKQGKKTKQVKG